MKSPVLTFPASLLVFALAGSFSANASIAYPDFSSSAGLDLNGAAQIANNGSQDVLRLTDALWQGGSAFSTSPVTLTGASFSTFFSFQITDPEGISDEDGQGADGLVFVVQTVSSSVGSVGMGIGYEGIADSVGIEFDTWNNGFGPDINGNHVGVNLEGSIYSVASTAVGTRMNDGNVWNAWVDYDGDTDLLEVRFSQGSRPASANLAYTVNLEAILGTPNAYVGFTSGTGAAGGNHDILQWQFNAEYDPIEGNQVVPEVQHYAPALGALLIAAQAARRRFQRA